MKMVLIRAAVALAVGLCCFGHIARGDEESHLGSANKIERYYYVKGMTCAGCVFGVKAALKRAGVPKENIKEVTYKEPDPDNHIGHAVVDFAAADYKGLESDCKIIKEIKSSPGYLAYTDPKNTNPCNL